MQTFIGQALLLILWQKSFRGQQTRMKRSSCAPRIGLANQATVTGLGRVRTRWRNVRAKGSTSCPDVLDCGPAGRASRRPACPFETRFKSGPVITLPRCRHYATARVAERTVCATLKCLSRESNPLRDHRPTSSFQRLLASPAQAVAFRRHHQKRTYLIYLGNLARRRG